MKIDTDVIAYPHEVQGIRQEWFDAGPDGRYPAYVAPRWGYTKPADQMEKLDRWSETKTGFTTEPLNLPYEPGARRCGHSRMCSWLSFYQTDFTNACAAFLDEFEMPVPSQDGFHWYMGARMCVYWLQTNMKRQGWTNVSRLSKLQDVSLEVVGEAGEDARRHASQLSDLYKQQKAV